MQDQKKIINKRRLQGFVVSDKMDKTIVVSLTSFKMHSKYKKQYKVSKTYKVHDERKQAKVGDQVLFEECRPLSKDKKWRLVKIVK